MTFININIKKIIYIIINNMAKKKDIRDRRQKHPKQYAEKKLLKPVVENNKPDSIMQFNVRTDVENDKKVRPKKIFQNYVPPVKKKS
jgi:hypothetical protein